MVIESIKKEIDKISQLLNRFHEDNILPDNEIVELQDMIMGILDKLSENSPIKGRIGKVMTGTAFRTSVSDAWYEGRDVGIELGISQGISQGIKSLVVTVKKLHGTKADAEKSIMEEYDKKEEEAKEWVERYW